MDSLRFESLPGIFKYGGEGGIRPLCRRHHGGSGVGSPALADAARPGPLFRHRRRSLRFESLPGIFKYGGEGGIRTLGTLRYTRFPVVHLRPLGHLSAGGKRYMNPAVL